MKLPILPLFALLMIAYLGYIAVNLQGDVSECIYNKHNQGQYSNSTEDYSRFGNECHVRVYGYYETRKECGTFGINCYESSKSHTERFYRDSVCFNVNTGESC